MKKIIVFGATGMVGLEIVKQSLNEGFSVTAFTRKGEMPIEHEQLNVIKGDTNNPNDVKNAIKEQDVIVSALGNRDYQEPVLVSHPNVLNIIQFIEKNQRLIILGAVSMLQADETTLVKNYLDPKIAAYVRYPLIDHFANYELLIKDKTTNWLMVCPPMIKEGSSVENYSTNENYTPDNTEMYVLSGDIGHYISQEIKNQKYNRTRIGIAAKK